MFQRYELEPIGTIHTPFSNTDIDIMPIQSARSKIPGSVIIKEEYQEGLLDLDGFSYIILLYTFHNYGEGFQLKVKPFLDDNYHGIFSTRYPNRPNHLGISIVELVSVQSGQLDFIGADMLDGTPLVDIKPYIPEFDSFAPKNTGWYTDRKYK